MRLKILSIVSMLVLSGCEVDPLNTQVQNPTHRAAFQTASGVVPSNQTLRVGQLVRFVISDSGYDGSGQATDISNFRSVNAVTCEGSSCPATNGATFSECRVQTGGATACVERNRGVVDTFTFYPDQRLSVDVASQGRFWSGVWYQTPSQQRRAASVYTRMMEGFIVAYGPSYARVADERAAAIDALANAGAAAAAINGQISGNTSPEIGSPSTSPVAPLPPDAAADHCVRFSHRPNFVGVQKLNVTNICSYRIRVAVCQVSAGTQRCPTDFRARREALANYFVYLAPNQRDETTYNEGERYRFWAIRAR